ncbi:YbjQ family protein [Paenibacillus sp. HWE-109]|uniref:YbjQ family protein n=1 Tax=Paenibacillus sp. HWE-109 TaxID=1306526 RepID=UPI001EDFD9D8|nr:YbjQ family protein [Paenibacillus sp. HWE-109]UKS25343.1 YbjQ family protein [Paenibacillus sp. HWE-109]
MAKNGVLITTTSVNEAIKLEHYRGIVSARVVTGVDLFSDLFASFSDVFGGRSATYQKQLKSIYDEVIHLLTEEAVKLGANAIVGVRIDHDEVSGKGKQMFMVTATGTSAFIPDYGYEKEVAAAGVKDEISFEKYQYEHKRLSMINNVNQDFNVVPNYWPTILEYYSPEVMAQVFKFYHSIDYDYNNSLENVFQYFAGVEEPLAKAFLYDKLQTNGKAMTVIKQAKLTDYDFIENLLVTNTEWIVKKYALVIVSGDKRKYHVDDIGKLEKLIHLVTRTFVQRGKHDSDKWTCECGKVNKSGIIYCKSCDQDDRGFKKGEVSIEDTLSKLKENLYVLQHIFGQA